MRVGASQLTLAVAFPGFTQQGKPKRGSKLTEDGVPFYSGKVAVRVRILSLLLRYFQ